MDSLNGFSRSFPKPTWQLRPQKSSNMLSIKKQNKKKTQNKKKNLKQENKTQN